MTRNISRTPPPRQLGTKETLESLTHWQNSFRTFYKRDDVYKRFFKSTISWDSKNPNYGFEADADVDKTAEDIAEDFMDLLNTLSGYLPFSYLTDKILKNTTSWADVWSIIYEHYNVQINGETLLDFESLVKQDDETHRQFFERLIQHVKKHLAPAGVKVESLINTHQDELSISIMNLVAVQWLRKINPALIEIVKVEYSTDLRDNVQLAHLV